MKPSAGLRRSARLFEKTKQKEVIDLVSPSPKKSTRPTTRPMTSCQRERDRESDRARGESTSPSSPNTMMARKLRETAGELLRRLPNLGIDETGTRHLENLAIEMIVVADHLKSGKSKCSAGSAPTAADRDEWCFDTDDGESESEFSSDLDEDYESADGNSLSEEKPSDREDDPSFCSENTSAPDVGGDEGEDEFSCDSSEKHQFSYGDESEPFIPSPRVKTPSSDNETDRGGRGVSSGDATMQREVNGSSYTQTDAESFKCSCTTSGMASTPNSGGSPPVQSPSRSQTKVPTFHEDSKENASPPDDSSTSKPCFGNSSGSSPADKSPPRRPRPQPKPSAFCEDNKENDFPICGKKDLSSEEKKGFEPPRPSFFSLVDAKPSTVTKKKKISKGEQAAAVEKVLRADQSGKGSHYRVLGLQTNASEAEIRKAYRNLSLKVHPDKNTTATNAGEAFKAVNAAHQVLKSPAKRAEYDRVNVPRPPASRSITLRHGSSPFNTIPAGTRVTIQSDISYFRSNGVEGTISSFQPELEMYNVEMDNGCKISMPPASLFQNTNVRSRQSRLVHTFGTPYATITLISPPRQGFPFFRGSCTRYDGTHAMDHIRCYDFVIPCETVVRLSGLEQRQEYNGSYGTVVDWVERIEDDGVDTSFYHVQLSADIIVRVKMNNVCL